MTESKVDSYTGGLNADKRTTKKKKCRLGTASNKITGGGGGGRGKGGLQLVCGRTTLALSAALVPQTLSCSVCVEDFLLINALS